MSHFISSQDGYYALTTGGYTALVILLIVVMLITAFIVDKKQTTKKINAKQLAFAGIALALAFVTSYIKYELPMGGSVTLFSMFFICYVGYLYGVKVGLLTAFAYSILQFIQSGGTYFLTPFQVCCDYFFAFTALGLAGIWLGKKHGLTIGYIVACLLRGLFHTIGGYIYWMDYMPEWFPKSLTSVYSIVYNYSYILVEMIITLIIINLPPVKKALEKVKTLA
ncbi:MAG: energy-coupled thiamine transporter ThiT [Lachnospiraceae bacterium]|nr:energy-coupled thiamine transporter ThiT [Lachnospiraceae bacterium]